MTNTFSHRPLITQRTCRLLAEALQSLSQDQVRTESGLAGTRWKPHLAVERRCQQWRSHQLQLLNRAMTSACGWADDKALYDYRLSAKPASYRVARKALSTLSKKSATVAENGEKKATVAEFGDSRTFLRQWPFSATICRRNVDRL